jgi:transposase
MARQRGGGEWIMGLIARKKPKVAAVAVANKVARVAWVLMARGEAYAPRLRDRRSRRQGATPRT